MAERSADWMDQARRDLAHARHCVDAEFYEWACFSSQQAAEKAAKAILIQRGTRSRVSSVAELLRMIDGMGAISPDLTDVALELDKAYIPARYPDAHPAGSPGNRYTRAEADRMVDHAARIVSACEDLLTGPFSTVVPSICSPFRGR